MSFLDSWHVIQSIGNVPVCADQVLKSGFTVRIDSNGYCDLTFAALLDIMVFDSKGWNIHNFKLSKIDVSTLGLDFIEPYRDQFIYKNVPKHLLSKVIEVLSGEKKSDDVAVKVVARQERACYRCKRMCDLGDKECWWCTAKDPTR